MGKAFHLHPFSLVVMLSSPCALGKEDAMEHAEVHRCNTSAAPRDKDRCLIFYHIPKSGGTSLFTLMMKDMGLQVWTHYDGPMAEVDEAEIPVADRTGGKGRRPARFEGADVFIGHWGPLFREDLRARLGMRRDCYQATMFREPLQRQISVFHEWSDGALTFSDLKALINQTQCKQFSSIDGYNTKKCDLEMVKQSISALDFVFIYPDFAGLQCMLAHIFGGAPYKAKKFPHLNSKTKVTFDKLSNKLKDSLIDNNALDLKLFAWVQETYANRTRRRLSPISSESDPRSSVMV